MADEEDEEETTVFTPPNELIEWDRIQLRPIRDQFHFQSQPQSPPLPDPHEGGGIWSTIHEDHQPLQPSVVFPPVNHEGIDLHHHNDVREIDVERAGPPSSDSDSSPRPATGESGVVRWWDAGVDALRFKIVAIVSFLRSFYMTRGGLFRSHFPLAGSLLLLLLFYWRGRRRRRRECVYELIRIIKEKDERIHQLLYQIARMNEILLTNHHGVSMISKSASH